MRDEKKTFSTEEEKINYLYSSSFESREKKKITSQKEKNHLYIE